MSSEKPNNIVKFNFYSSVDKKTYRGLFKVRRISVFGINDIQNVGNVISNGLAISNPAHATVVQRMATIDHVVDEVLEGGDWFFKDDPRKTWDTIFDTSVCEELYKEVIKFDDWFRLDEIPTGDKKKDEEKSNRESKTTSTSINNMGGKKSTHESKESGVSEVVVG